VAAPCARLGSPNRISANSRVPPACAYGTSRLRPACRLASSTDARSRARP
jgi:hypothetical protein